MKKDRKVFTNSKKEFKKLEDIRTQYKAKCKRCGHTVVLNTTDKTICNHCGYYIFKDAKTEFQYRMMEAKYKKEREA